MDLRGRRPLRPPSGPSLTFLGFCLPSAVLTRTFFPSVSTHVGVSVRGAVLVQGPTKAKFLPFRSRFAFSDSSAKVRIILLWEGEITLSYRRCRARIFA